MMSQNNSCVYEYFSQLNTLSKKISQDINHTKCVYSDLWHKLNSTEQAEVLNDVFIKPELTLRYYEDDTTADDNHSDKLQNVNVKNSKSHSIYDWLDEHSSPFSYRTKSQTDLLNMYGNALKTCFWSEHDDSEIANETQAKQTPKSVNEEVNHHRTTKLLKFPVNCEKKRSNFSSNLSESYDFKEKIKSQIYSTDRNNQLIDDIYEVNDSTRLIHNTNSLSNKSLCNSDESIDVIFKSEVKVNDDINLLNPDTSYCKKGFEFLNNW